MLRVMFHLPRRVAPWVLMIWVSLAACSVSTVHAVRRELSESAETDDELGSSNSIAYFSVPAFFITFRETIEVCGPRCFGVIVQVRIFCFLWTLLLKLKSRVLLRTCG